MQTESKRLAEHKCTDSLPQGYKGDRIPCLIHMSMEHHEDHIDREDQTYQNASKIPLIHQVVQNIAHQIKAKCDLTFRQDPEREYF